MPTAPTKNGIPLDQFNDALRASPGWQDFMRRAGQAGTRVQLSDMQRRQLQRELERAGVRFPQGMEIDPAGNVNQANQGFFQNKWVQIGLAGAGALATMGALGYGPLASLLGGGGQAASGGALASSSIPGAHAAVPGAIASQGVSASLGAAAPLASSSLPASMLMGGMGAGGTAGLGTAVGSGAGGAAAAARGLANGAASGGGVGGFGKDMLDKFLSPEGVIGLAGLIPALMSKPPNIADDPNVRAQMDIAKQGQQMQLDRYKRTDPLHEAVTRAAYSMLPIAARNK